MENASKALLIAAAVLIAIILVTISIKILSPTTSVVEDSEKIGSAISSSSKDAVANFENSMGGGKWTQNGTVVKKGSLTLEVGDYINYDPGVSGYTGKWRILGVENGQLLIVSDRIKVTDRYGNNVSLLGAEGYNNIVNTMNNACINYGKGKGAVSVRAMKVEDINRVTGYNPIQWNKGNIKQYGNEITYTVNSEGNTVYYEATNGLKGSYGIDNDFINIDGTKLTSNNSITLKGTYYNYRISNYVDNEKAYNMLKLGCDLASPFINIDKSGASFGCMEVLDAGVCGTGLYSTTVKDIYRNNYIHPVVRAVVYLESDIQLQKNGDTWQIV